MKSTLQHRLSVLPFVAVFVVIATAGLVAAEAPAGYYDSSDASSAAMLRLTLHDIIDDHTRFPYTSSSTDVWDILNQADEDPNDANAIVDVYHNASYQKIAGGTGAYNREHSWPKSYGFPKDGSSNYPYTDCHHLFASDSSYNSSRSNKPFRTCTSGCSEKTTLLTNGRGGGSGVYPGNSNWTEGSLTAGTWETWSGRRGDVARAMFYMAIRYEGGTHGITGKTEPDLELTDSESLIASSNTGSNIQMAYMGMLSDLLAWHVEDPVDDIERYRNDVVFSHQGNRNPFIDHPEWASCVFNGVCSVDSVPPAAPAGLLANPGINLVDLDWADNTEPDMASYSVYRSTTSGGPYTLLATVTASDYSDITAVGGTTYYYVVTANDSSANESVASSEQWATALLGDLAPPSAPVGLAAISGLGVVDLSWTANFESDLAGYDVYRSTSSGGPYTRVNGPLISATSYSDTSVTGGVTYYYVITAWDTSDNESSISSEVWATPEVAAGGGTILLSEVIYDVSGTDSGLEWVELYNAGSQAVDLSGWSLGNGGTSYTYSLVQLSGTVLPGATFVVGGPTSNATNGAPTFDLTIDFNPDFQNSGTTADGIALFDVAAALVSTSTVPVDAVVYGSNNSSGLIDETGSANSPETGDAPSGSSLERVDLAGTWQIQSVPNPNVTSLAAPSNTAPSVTISSPTNGSSFTVGDSISFSGSASDSEDGSLSGVISWTSSLDGAIGSGATFSNSSLSIGSHTITAAVTDSGGLSASQTISLTIDPPPNTAPSVAISAPANGSSFTAGDSVSFSGSASDLEDGSLSSGINWTSNRDGAIGSGATFSISSLSVGSHTITASVTDSGGLSATHAISLTVDPLPNTAPSVTISAPTNGSSFTVGDSVSFSGSASDSEDGSLSAVISWTSNLDGAIGSGSTFSISSLSIGSHTITATVTDSGGLSASDTISVTVNPAPNGAPTVTITDPADGSSFSAGTMVTFNGSASDAEDGNLSGLLVWTSDLDGNLGSGASVSTASLSVGSHIITATVTDSGALQGSASITLSVTVVQPAALLLSEVFYDSKGNDNGLEWVELYNAGDNPVDLSGYSLGSGGTSYTYSTLQLSGIVQPGATFVVGGPTSDAKNGAPVFDLVANFAPDLQNSGATADGVALFDLPANQITGASIPVDAVIYGGSNASGLIDETGVANSPEVGDAPSGSSIERVDLAGSWQVQSGPTPNQSAIGGPVSNTAPVVTISSPTDGASVTSGGQVVFAGSANDSEDGDISASLTWSSSLDGNLGGGASFSLSTLSVGSHVISASVTDSGGSTSSDTVALTITSGGGPVELILTSVASQDGWIRESKETSNSGGSVDDSSNASDALRLGDDRRDRQYRSILSFDTSAIPSGAVIVSATLRLNRGQVSGTDPLTTHGTATVDLMSGGFSGSTNLESSDFQAGATVAAAALLTDQGSWLEGSLNALGLSAINASGTTQARIQMDLDDNDDRGNDIAGFSSGNSGDSNLRPQLVVVYQ